MENKLIQEQVERIIESAHLKSEIPQLNGMDLSEIDLTGMNLSRADLSGALLFRTNLREVDLTDANLREANLIMADLGESNLYMANLTGADLSEANLSEANLKETNLHLANLIEADLTLAYLFRANLSEANLLKANLSRATIGYCMFGNVDLRGAQGLEKVTHIGPSSIGIDTIFEYGNVFPEIFLRGCGLNDVQIEMAKLHDPNLTQDQIVDITYRISHLLSGDAIKYKSCFISYSSEDEAFATHLYDNLQDSGVRCWFAPEDMKIGDKIRPAIDQSIRVHDKLLIILSENSLNSFWVESEVEKAFEEERKRKQTVLFPIRLDETVMETNQPWAAEIRRTRHIGDFSRWKDHDAYQQAFERLLRDLKAEGEIESERQNG